MKELLSGLIGPVTGIINKVTPRGVNGRPLAHSISAIGKHVSVSVVVKVTYGISLINSFLKHINKLLRGDNSDVSAATIQNDVIIAY
jgi:hypothetical protein